MICMDHVFRLNNADTAAEDLGRGKARKTLNTQTLNTSEQIFPLPTEYFLLCSEKKKSKTMISLSVLLFDLQHFRIGGI